MDEARKDGYTETILGRRRYLPDLTSDNRQRREMAERMALNAPIQGSAADIIKVAMLDVHRALAAEDLRSRMLLQVHDELVLEVAHGEREAVEALVRREMGAAVRAVGAAGRVGGLRTQLGPGRTLTRRIRSTPSLGTTDDSWVRTLAWNDPLPARPRRILVAGTSGAGKTTVAVALAGRLGIPHTDIDGLYHGPRWVPRPEFADDVAALVAGEEWVTEWQYSAVRPAPARPRGSAGLARPHPRRGDAPDRAAHAPSAAAPRRAVERQRRTAAVDDPDPARPHPALGLAHPPEDPGPHPAGAPSADPPAVVRLRTRREIHAWLDGPVARLAASR